MDRLMPMWIVDGSVAFSVIVGLLLRRNVDDESPHGYGRWAVLGVCTIIAVGAFVLGMGWLAGEL